MIEILATRGLFDSAISASILFLSHWSAVSFVARKTAQSFIFSTKRTEHL